VGAFLYCLSAQITFSSENNAQDLTEMLKAADSLQKQGYYDRAIPILQKVLVDQKAVLGNEHAEVARLLDRLGELHYLAGKYRDAETLLKEAVSLREKLFGPEHEETAESYDHFGHCYDFLAEYDLSKKILKMPSQ
jgi:tetratricopeptide (TPR) repeat protein